MKDALTRNKGLFVCLGLLLFSFALCYWHEIVGLYRVWVSDEDYSYSFLLPPIAAYLIWEERHRLRGISLRWNPYGAIALVFFLVVSAYGILGSSPSAVRPAIPLMMLSVILFSFGTEAFRVLWFPFALLIFMVPLPTMFGSFVGVHLRTLSTKLGEIFLRLAGVSVFVEGNIVDLGWVKLQVVEACSGLRYLLPLMALGAIFGHFFEKVRWKKLLIFVATIPVAIVANGIRIGITGLLTEHFGAKVAEGFFHAFSGWLIFMLAFGLLYVFHAVLKLFPGKAGGVSQGPARDNETKVAKVSPTTYFAAVIASALFLGLSCIAHLSGALPRIGLKSGLARFPATFAQWRGTIQNIDAEMITASGAEEAFSCEYVNNRGDIVSLYIGYRGSPFLENYNFFHSPNVCLPSSGWRTVLLAKHTIGPVEKFGQIVVREMIVEKMGRRQLVYYWFQTKDKTSWDVNINRFHLSLHALKRDNTYDLFIRVITPVKDYESIDSTENRLDDFVKDFMVELFRFLDKNAQEESHRNDNSG